ncbi:D-3-phosphoglycerate dehydrogenase [Lunatimonas lonarensis]|uniref:D-3-phosphoglycerate dehydrogenase n=1 Tax=Lunatimonas lonarensis TaxID=1232681 RepID=R7ZSW9_9BACT|nr:NAD(P)-dependent oxidoreductase [Lunatimonas lonarensis]EON77177.1 D-3-phosphoglycerate dehydrogenase [Lunatimonas lonarensis]
MKVLIIDTMHPSILPLLEGAGYEVHYRPDITRTEILECVAEYEGLIIRSKTPIDRSLLAHAVKLRFVARAGAGLDNIDLDYLASHGIALHHASEGNRDAVAEHAVGMILMLFNKLGQADRQVRSGIWDREGNRGEELAGKTVGVIGYGNMGRAFVQRLRGFDVRILAYDKYLSGYGDQWVEEATFKRIQEEVDLLSIHVPLTDETRNFLTMEVLEGFRKPFYLVNTARGEVVSFDTLNEALSRNILKGALLDVLENERLNALSNAQRISFKRLTERTNVLFSPHVAGWTSESYVKINQVLVEKITGKWGASG